MTPAERILLLLLAEVLQNQTYDKWWRTQIQDLLTRVYDETLLNGAKQEAGK